VKTIAFCGLVNIVMNGMGSLCEGYSRDLERKGSHGVTGLIYLPYPNKACQHDRLNRAVAGSLSLNDLMVSAHETK